MMIKLPRSLLFLVLVAACAKSKVAPGPAGIENTAVTAPSPARTLQDDLAAMPKGTEMVMGLDVAQLRRSALFKAYEPELLARLGDELREFEAMCGFDPMLTLDHVLMGSDLPMNGSPNAAVVFVRGFDRSKTFTCLQKTAAKNAGEGKTVVFDGGHFELKAGSELKFRGLFVDQTTVLFIKQGDGFADKAALVAAAAARQGEGLTASPVFVKLLDSVDTSAPFFMLINGNATALQQSPLPFKLRAILCSVRVDAELHGEVRVRLDDADAASEMVGLYQMGVGEIMKTPAGRFLDHVEVTAEGPDSVARFRFDQASLDAMIELARSM